MTPLGSSHSRVPPYTRGTYPLSFLAAVKRLVRRSILESVEGGRVYQRLINARKKTRQLSRDMDSIFDNLALYERQGHAGEVNVPVRFLAGRGKAQAKKKEEEKISAAEEDQVAKLADSLGAAIESRDKEKITAEEEEGVERLTDSLGAAIQSREQENMSAEEEEEEEEGVEHLVDSLAAAVARHKGGGNDSGERERSADNTDKDVDRLVDVLADVMAANRASKRGGSPQSFTNMTASMAHAGVAARVLLDLQKAPCSQLAWHAVRETGTSTVDTQVLQRFASSLATSMAKGLPLPHTSPATNKKRLDKNAFMRC
ncbi:unnamed protein product [Vitrella brassicaformis CCMP3155]|uniref:Uncharacterized protein n=1 Tax=Vitrella brassicaformis (strain CCMP3155) TaxID=1169540 RepID=A0A0G4GXP0_VITBC|nr:unnamed protein product [Vitrella brassicaformis CCMP3155]|eukprot:CEM35894.1 unnamed protein product [Vitrella brassicaformis CCMP3155]